MAKSESWKKEDYWLDGILSLYYEGETKNGIVFRKIIVKHYSINILYKR